MKREGLHCLVVHPASLEECEEEDRGRGREERERGMKERGRKGEGKEGRKEGGEGGRKGEREEGEPENVYYVVHALKVN